MAIVTVGDIQADGSYTFTLQCSNSDFEKIEITIYPKDGEPILNDHPAIAAAICALTDQSQEEIENNRKLQKAHRSPGY